MGRRPLALLAGLLALYLALPLIAFAVRLVTSSQRGFGVPGLWPALWVSVSSATIALAITTVLGVPLAYLLARSSGRLAGVVGVLVQIPLALPPLMSGIILIYLVGPYSTLGRLFDGDLTNSRVGVVIAMTFVSAPFLVVAARAGFSTVDRGLTDVASTLGHSEVSSFLRVAVPAAGPSIRAGMVLAWLRAFGEFGAVVVLAYNPTSLPVFTYNQFSGVGLPTTLAPTALAVGVAVVVVALSRVHGRPPVVQLTGAGAVAPSRAEPGAVRFSVDQRLGDFHLQLERTQPVTHLSVVGPSGAGKSALLRSLAGLHGASSSRFWCGEVALHEVAPTERRVGYVAQGFSLFPNRTVWQQLLFARGATPGLAAYWLGQLQLTGLENRRPEQLSGGQRQRVALAQALCSSPRVLLLDEPFSALDVPVRLELRGVLRRLQRETGLATIIVTHDPEEAAYLGDEMTVVSAGRELQSGPSRDLYEHPATPEVARLVGIANIHEAVVAAAGLLDAHGCAIRAETGDMEVGQRVIWTVSPEALSLQDRGAILSDPEAPGEPIVLGTLLDVVDLGTTYECLVSLAPDLEVRLRTRERVDVRPGDAVGVVITPECVSLWPAG